MTTVRKIIGLLFIILITNVFVCANPIRKSDLAQLGTAAFHQRATSLCPSAAQYALKDIRYVGDQGGVLLAILNFDDGFLVLAADDAVEPVLAYSFTGHFYEETAAPGALFMLNEYKNSIKTARGENLRATSEIQNQWDAIKYKSPNDTVVVVVSPLITAKWNQNKYYNWYSPIDNESPAGYNSRTPNGCVAVAMAQIMYYYRYPEQGTGSHTNYTDYGNFYVNFGQQRYCYEAMEDQLIHHNDEVAKLIFHCATSVNMQYSAEGSGAYSQDVPEAVRTYFGYSSNCEYRSKYSYNTSQWRQMLKNELNIKHPIYYSGYSQEGGHAFVCDGYNSDNLFHFNFGWGGSSNGFYTVSSYGSNPVNGYGNGQAAIFSFCPPESSYPYYCSPRVVNCHSGTLEDGSGPYDYGNKQNCLHLLTDDKATSVNIHIQSFNTEEDHDYLYIRDTHDSVLLAMSGGMPSVTNYIFYTDSVWVQFVTDDSISGAGWRLTYEFDNLMQACHSGLKTEPTGTLSDGSGPDDYNPNMECMWVFRNSAASYTFSFDTLDISPEDALTFSDVSNGPTELVKIVTGNTIPADFTIESPKIVVSFFSDNYKQGQGFSFTWNVNSPEAVEDFEEDDIALYPNPSHDWVRIVLPELQEDVRVLVYDVMGRVVYQNNFSANEVIELNTSNLNSGFYTVICQSPNKRFEKKMVVAR
ncbi:MAG: C10 family peptidase [Bacteroidales bacterium]|nr:C10 family peptidase [Bacteroidales bacterium]